MNKAAVGIAETIHWDRRNGVESYPFPHNQSWGWQQCPECSVVVLAMEIGCDYYPATIKCKCGNTVVTLGVTDDGRFSGLHDIFIAAEGRAPIVPGEVPVNSSESVRDEFESMNRTGIWG